MIIIIVVEYPIPTQRPPLVLVNKKTRICYFVNFVVPVNH